MYSTIFQGKKIRIEDDHLEQLLERFDHQKFRSSYNTYHHSLPRMRNNVPCILCKSFYPHDRWCVGCPLSKFKSSAYPGCIVVMTALVSNNSPLHAFIGSVVYPIPSRAQAVKDLKTITKFLKSFKKEKSHG